jgi:hypothetical protein
MLLPGDYMEVGVAGPGCRTPREQRGKDKTGRQALPARADLIAKRDRHVRVSKLSLN